MKRISFLLLCLCLCFTSVASAASIEIVERSGFNIDFWYDGTLTESTLQGNPDPVGEFNIKLGGFSRAAFCVEMNVAYGSGDADLTIPAIGSAYFQAAWLMDSFSTGLGFDFNQLKTDFTFPNDYTGDVYTIYNEDTKIFSDSNLETVSLEPIGGFNDVDLKNIADVALQIAIWETLYEDDFSNGLYKVTKDDDPQIYTSMDFADNGKRLMAWTLADMYAGRLQEASDDGLSEEDFSGKYKFHVAEFVDKQNLLVAKPIPEPATIMLFGLGLLGISAIGRKRG